jgi:CheY-like chemotaxis protein
MAKRILIADDEAHIRSLLELQFSQAGYEVSPVSDGQQALELCLEVPPDLAVIDNRMPGMSGLDLCICLRQDHALGRLPIIILTALEFELSADKLRQADVACVISKPFSPRELLSKVASLLAPPSRAAC